MELQKLIRGGFLHKDLVRRMGDTTPGVLAQFVDQLLYVIQDEKDTPRLSFTDNKAYLGRGVDKALGKPWPEVAGMTPDGNYMDIRRGLREVVHYLEACALREAQS